jgi:hypothetical protein
MKNYHSEGDRAPRKQGRHQRRRYQQCDASAGSRASTLAASLLHLTIPVPVDMPSQSFGVEKRFRLQSTLLPEIVFSRLTIMTSPFQTILIVKCIKESTSTQYWQM